MRMLVEEDHQEINQLKELKKIVNEWRDNKKHVSEKIPDSIWNALFELLKNTTIPEIEVLKAVGIKSEQINSKRKLLGIEQSLTSSKPIKINGNKEMSLNNELDKTSTTTLIEMQKPDGTLIKFHIRDNRFSEFVNIIRN